MIVIVTETGKLGLETYLEKGSNYFDVILMDLMMPEMDGYQATRRIRKSELEDAKTIPIYAVTAILVEDFKKNPDSQFFTNIIKNH